MASIDHPSGVINSIMLTEQVVTPSTPPAGKQQLYVSASGLRLLNSTGSSISVSFGVSTPTSASATGVKGTIYYDSSYIYICTATNIWKRASISSW